METHKLAAGEPPIKPIRLQAVDCIERPVLFPRNCNLAAQSVNVATVERFPGGKHGRCGRRTYGLSCLFHFDDDVPGVPLQTQTEEDAINAAKPGAQRSPAPGGMQ